MAFRSDAQRRAVMRRIRESGLRVRSGAEEQVELVRRWTVRFTLPDGREAVHRFKTEDEAEDYASKLAVGVPVVEGEFIRVPVTKEKVAAIGMGIYTRREPGYKILPWKEEEK